MFQQTVKNDIWGKYGFPSHKDHSVSEDVKLKTIKMMGYDSNDFEFNSWLGITSSSRAAGDYEDLAPYSISLIYNPLIIPSEPPKVELYTERRGGVFGCEIPSIPTISKASWIPYPTEKTDQTWKNLYAQLTKSLRSIEAKLYADKWFFPKDNFEMFLRDSDGFKFDGNLVSFHRVKFGSRGSQWGTLWYFCDKQGNPVFLD